MRLPTFHNHTSMDLLPSRVTCMLLECDRLPVLPVCLWNVIACLCHLYDCGMRLPARVTCMIVECDCLPVLSAATAPSRSNVPCLACALQCPCGVGRPDFTRACVVLSSNDTPDFTRACNRVTTTMVSLTTEPQPQLGGKEGMRLDYGFISLRAVYHLYLSTRLDMGATIMKVRVITARVRFRGLPWGDTS